MLPGRYYLPDRITAEVNDSLWGIKVPKASGSCVRVPKLHILQLPSRGKLEGSC